MTETAEPAQGTILRTARISVARDAYPSASRIAPRAAGASGGAFNGFPLPRSAAASGAGSAPSFDSAVTITLRALHTTSVLWRLSPSSSQERVRSLPVRCTRAPLTKTSDADAVPQITTECHSVRSVHLPEASLTL